MNRKLIAYLITSSATLGLVYLLTVSALWQAYELTGNVAQVGLVSLFQFLPALLLFPWVGQVADRYPKRAILLVTTSAYVVLSVAMVVLSGKGAISVGWLFLAVALVSSIRAFEATTLASWVPEWTPSKQLSRALAWVACSKQIAKIAAPALSGVLLIARPDGFFVYAVMVVLALTALSAMLVFPAPKRRLKVAIAPSAYATWEGLRYVGKNQILLGALLLDLVAGLLGGFTAMIPVFAKEFIHTDAAGAGVLRSMLALGSLVGALGLASLPLKNHLGRYLVNSVTALGIITLLLAQTTSFPIAALLIAVFGAFDSISVNIRQTLIQIATPSTLRGRVSATGQIAILVSNQLGEFRAGMMGALIGVYPAIVLGGACTVVAAMAWSAFFPRLFYLQRFEDALPHSKLKPSLSQ